MLKAIFSRTELRYPAVVKIATAFIFVASWISVVVTGNAALPFFFNLLIFTPICAACYLLVERYYTPLVLALCFGHITFIALAATYFYLLNTSGLIFAVLFDVALAGLLLGGRGATLTTGYILLWIIGGDIILHYHWLGKAPRNYSEPNLSAFIVYISVSILIVLGVYVVVVFFAQVMRQVIGEMGIERDRLNQAVMALEEQRAREAEAAQAVSEATVQLSSATQVQAGGVQEQVVAVEQVSTSAAQLDDAARQIVERTQIVSDLAQRVNDEATIGSQLISEVTTAMQSAHETVKAVVERGVILGEQVRDISIILELLLSIAKETHILSLNAAIEAAAAEDTRAGRRFSVIAAEVEELAKRAAGATEQVGGIMGQIKQAVNLTSIATFESMVETERSVSSLLQMRELAETLKQLAGSTSDAASAIHSSVEEQRRGSSQIALSLRQIGGVAEQNAQSSQQLLQVADQLGGLVSRLRRAELSITLQ